MRKLLGYFFRLRNLFNLIDTEGNNMGQLLGYERKLFKLRDVINGLLI
jgi:hypothetical protein